MMLQRSCAPTRVSAARARRASVAVRAAAATPRIPSRRELMATVALGLSAAPLVAAPPSSAAAAAAPATANAPQAFIAALRLGLSAEPDKEAVAKVCAENVVIADALPGGPVGGVFRGRKGIEAWVAASTKLQEVTRIRVDKVYNDKSEYVVLADMTAVNKKTKRTYSLPVVYSLKVNSNGQVVNVRALYDTAVLSAAAK